MRAKIQQYLGSSSFATSIQVKDTQLTCSKKIIFQVKYTKKWKMGFEPSLHKQGGSEQQGQLKHRVPS